MKKLLTAAAILVGALAAAVGPVTAGPKGDKENALRKTQEEQDKRQNKDLDRAYNEMMKRTGTAAKPYDHSCDSS